MDKENVNSSGHCKSIPESKGKPVMISGAGNFVCLIKVSEIVENKILVFFFFLNFY